MRKNSKSRNIKIKFPIFIITLIVVFSLMCGSAAVSANEVTRDNMRVMIGGNVFGTRVSTEGVLVVGVVGVVSNGVERFPARDAGICSKDIINSVNGTDVKGSADLVMRIEQSEGKSLEIGLTRGEKKMSVTLTPILSDSDGSYKGGLWIRDSFAGIGTVTFINPETGEFAGLGHGICDPDTGVLMPISRGAVFGVELRDIKKGSAGDPGELRGHLAEKKIGSVVSNTQSGVYGILSELSENGEIFEVAHKDEVKTGEVSIVCAVKSGIPTRYSAVIERISDANGDTKNFIIKVTDKRLLDITGGIVQGMSGSPIIQNGKLVGAVTHVLIDDPTRGYGIFAENMLNQMGDLAR